MCEALSRPCCFLWYSRSRPRPWQLTHDSDAALGRFAGAHVAIPVASRLSAVAQASHTHFALQPWEDKAFYAPWRFNTLAVGARCTGQSTRRGRGLLTALGGMTRTSTRRVTRYGGTEVTDWSPSVQFRVSVTIPVAPHVAIVPFVSHTQVFCRIPWESGPRLAAAAHAMATH